MAARIESTTFVKSLYFRVLVVGAMAACLLVLVPRAEAVNGTPGGSCVPFFDGQLCLDKTASPNPVNLGEPLAFTITLTNTSATYGYDPELTDDLPASVNFESAPGAGSSPQANCPSTPAPGTPDGTAKCNLRVFGGETGTLVINVTPTQCGTFTNTVTIPPNSGIQGLTAQTTFTVVGEGCPAPTTPATPTTPTAAPPTAAPPTAAPPTCPPPTQGFSERRITSGGASPSTAISNAGDNANLSPTSQQTAQTGNVANEQGVVQSCSTAGDVDLSGSSMTISPSTTSESTQTLEQSAAS